jgi:hypothetical protein
MPRNGRQLGCFLLETVVSGHSWTHGRHTRDPWNYAVSASCMMDCLLLFLNSRTIGDQLVEARHVAVISCAHQVQKRRGRSCWYARQESLHLGISRHAAALRLTVVAVFQELLLQSKSNRDKLDAVSSRREQAALCEIWRAAARFTGSAKMGIDVHQVKISRVWRGRKCCASAIGFWEAAVEESFCCETNSMDVRCRALPCT